MWQAVSCVLDHSGAGYWYRLNALSFQRKLESSVNASLSGFLLAQE